MAWMTRRAALAAGATLALGAAPRKPRAEDLQFGQLQLRDPPQALPSGLRWIGPEGATHHVGDYAGSGLVLNFWATWCGPCAAEMPSLATLSRALAAANVRVIPISTDSGGAPAVHRFYDTHNIRGLGANLDPQQAASQAIGVQGLPTTIILDRRGLEVARVEGGANWTGSGTAATIAALCNM